MNGRTGDTIRIGLTGPIGCGKSTIARWLADAGGVVVDADALARETTAPGQPALVAIHERFGDDVFADDGTLDRAALAGIVFSDPDALRDLEGIVHPAVRVLIEAAVARAEASGAPFVVIEAIKLVEGGYGSQCDEVWLVSCRRDTQRSRLSDRGFDPDDLDRRLAAQAGLVERLAPSATRILNTDASAASTREAVELALREALVRGR